MTSRESSVTITFVHDGRADAGKLALCAKMRYLRNMDSRTGEILYFESTAELQRDISRRFANGEPPLIELKRKPKGSCRKCYGRGFVGRNQTTGDVVTCSCVR